VGVRRCDYVRKWQWILRRVLQILQTGSANRNSVGVWRRNNRPAAPSEGGVSRRPRPGAGAGAVDKFCCTAHKPALGHAALSRWFHCSLTHCLRFERDARFIMSNWRTLKTRVLLPYWALGRV